jgi:hypothetical protein
MFLTGWARAAGLRVAIVRTRDAAPLVSEATTLLGAVLVAAGFDTMEVDARTANDARRAIEQGGDGTRVFATLALRPVASSTEIDVWIADSMTQKTSVRRVAVMTRNRSAASREVALQAVDLLRASLLELESPPSPSAKESSPLERAPVRAQRAR